MHRLHPHSSSLMSDNASLACKCGRYLNRFGVLGVRKFLSSGLLVLCATTRTRTRARAHTHHATRAHTYINTPHHTRTHTHTHTRTRTHTHTHTHHTHTRTHTHLNFSARFHFCSCSLYSMSARTCDMMSLTLSRPACARHGMVWHGTAWYGMARKITFRQHASRHSLTVL